MYVVQYKRSRRDLVNSFPNRKAKVQEKLGMNK
ncbi:unnamed protein product [Ectocarpus sp. CCAP 1310/34]|nr:unnamed protein product [Ectocarpus sp. CCAP 1310/34]